MPEPVSEIKQLSDGTTVMVKRGSKSDFDFRVVYRRPEHHARQRQPSHMHLIIDLYMKRMGNPWLTGRLLDHMISVLSDRSVPASEYPPRLTHFSPEAVAKFAPLDSFGEYSVEFILVVGELLALAERTNYPTGTLHRELLSKFREGAEIYAVVSAARWRGG